MLEQWDQMDTEERAAPLDLLNLDLADPDGGLCRRGRHSGGACCGRHARGQEPEPV